MATTAVRDLDDTSLHTWQQELGFRRSEITIDVNNFDNERCHDPHIPINRNQITVRKVSWIRKTGEFVSRAAGWCSDSDNEIDFRFPFAGAPSGEAELNNALHPNHMMKCIHTVHRHERCYECCCYACCQSTQCHSRTQMHWRE